MSDLRTQCEEHEVPLVTLSLNGSAIQVQSEDPERPSHEFPDDILAYAHIIENADVGSEVSFLGERWTVVDDGIGLVVMCRSNLLPAGC